MKTYQEENGWIIKEKDLDEVPSFVDDTKVFAVFAPQGFPYYGKFMEDNLTLEEAIEWCQANNDLVAHQ